MVYSVQSCEKNADTAKETGVTGGTILTLAPNQADPDSATALSRWGRRVPAAKAVEDTTPYAQIVPHGKRSKSRIPLMVARLRQVASWLGLAIAVAHDLSPTTHGTSSTIAHQLLALSSGITIAFNHTVLSPAGRSHTLK